MDKIMEALKAVDFKAVFSALMEMIVAAVKDIFAAEVPEFKGE